MLKKSKKSTSLSCFHTYFLCHCFTFFDFPNIAQSCYNSLCYGIFDLPNFVQPAGACKAFLHAHISLALLR